MGTRHPLSIGVLLLVLAACEPSTTGPSETAGMDPLGPLATVSLESPSGLYSVQPLGTLPGYSGMATDVNDNGTAVVRLDPHAPGELVRVFVWSAGSGLVDLAAPLENQIAYRINQAGTISGERTVAGVRTAFRWTAGAGFEDLPPLSGYTSSRATDIDESGRVVGSSGSAPDEMATLWGVDGVPQPLGGLGGSYSRAFGMNDSGVVVGEAETADGSIDGFRWSAVDGMTPLGLVEASGARSRPLDLNESGDMVGIRFLDLLEGTRHGFYLPPPGPLIDLHDAAGITSEFSAAREITSGGEVVLSAQVGDDFGDDHAGFVWSPEQGFVQLPNLVEGGTATASGFSQSGRVAGGSGADRLTMQAVVWTPLTFGEAVSELEDLLAGLVTREVDSHGLEAKLAAIRESIAAGDAATAIEQLQAFINQVGALVRSGRLAAEEGERLIAAAQDLIDALT